MQSNQAVENFIAELERLLDEAVITKSLPFATLYTDIDEVDTLDSSQVPWEYFVVEAPIYGVFNKVAKSYEGRNPYYLELISSTLVPADFQSIESLTNHIYEILKDHTAGQGKFNPTDFQKLSGGLEWLGKMWIHYGSTSLITLSMKNRIANLSVIYYGRE